MARWAVNVPERMHFPALGERNNHGATAWAGQQPSLLWFGHQQGGRNNIGLLWSEHSFFSPRLQIAVTMPGTEFGVNFIGVFGSACSRKPSFVTVSNGSETADSWPVQTWLVIHRVGSPSWSSPVTLQGSIRPGIRENLLGRRRP
jgi:hypothetical protein